MSIENFKNPWAEGGEYSKNNALKNNVLDSYNKQGNLTEHNGEASNDFNSVKKVIFRLLFYGGSREHDDLFLRALKNVSHDYKNDLPEKTFSIENAQTITKTLHSSRKNSIQSLDVFCHGGPVQLYFKTGEAFGSNDLYRYETDMPVWKSLSDHLQNINYDSFTNNAKVEFHGCATGSDEEEFNFARVFSFGLKLANKENAVVIGHATSTNPDKHTTLHGDDYRHGLRRIFHAGETLFLTKQEGRISADTINFYLRKKSLTLSEGKEYIGEDQKTWKD